VCVTIYVGSRDEILHSSDPKSDESMKVEARNHNKSARDIRRPHAQGYSKIVLPSKLNQAPVTHRVTNPVPDQVSGERGGHFGC
jgi:hypothetical protein